MVKEKEETFMLKVEDFQGILHFFSQIFLMIFTDNFRILLYKVHNQADGWYILQQNEVVSHHSDYGYQSYYYYCEDVTSFLNTTWIPVLAWLTVNIVPLLLLVFLSNVTNLKIFLDLPDSVLLALLSHFNVGVTVKENHDDPNRLSDQTRKYGLSKLMSALNILITGVSTIVTLHLCYGPRFGPGDGAFLKYVTYRLSQ